MLTPDSLLNNSKTCRRFCRVYSAATQIICNLQTNKRTDAMSARNNVTATMLVVSVVDFNNKQLSLAMPLHSLHGCTVNTSYNRKAEETTNHKASLSLGAPVHDI